MLLTLLGCADPTVKEPYRERDLTLEEIRAKLRSGDFQQRLEASKQIDKLEPEERLRVLLRLSEDADAPTRLLAVKKLRSTDDARAKARLEKMASTDPDPTVREVAGKRP